tara:strand:- start:67 stop:624 length:558 start_codon:yes stop_codon:yes gene_type:complete
MAFSKIAAENLGGSALPALAGGSLTGVGGLVEADEWRLTTAVTGSADPISSNWERNDTLYDKIGTGWTESSGIFTAPSTGIYLIEFSASFWCNTNERYIEMMIQGSNDGFSSNTQTIAFAYSSIAIDEASATYNAGTARAIYDITNTSNNKLKFRISREQSSNAQAEANTSKNGTSVTFLKLGDT